MLEMIKTRRLIAIAILFMALAYLFTRQADLLRGFETTLLLADFGDKAIPAWLDKLPPSTVQTVTIDAGGRRYSADLYLPATEPQAGIVLQHGASATGKDDPRLVAFAHLLARARFAVLVPELPGPKTLRIRAGDAQGVIDAHHYLRQELGDNRPIGIGAFSISAGLAVLAALDPAIRDDTDFLLLVGAYHDLPETLNYGITGYYQAGRELRYQAPNPYGKWLFVLSNNDGVGDPREQQYLQMIANSRLHNPHAAVDALVKRLEHDGKAVMDYVQNSDPARAPALYSALPAPVHDVIDALDLNNKPLEQLHARLLLVHGYDDAVIPYTQSQSLHQAVPSNSQLFLYHGLQHVDSGLEQLQDAWPLWRAFYALLQERDGVNRLAR